MKILIDMQLFQRLLYANNKQSLHILDNIIKRKNIYDIHLLFNGMMHESVIELRKYFLKYLPNENIHIWHGVDVSSKNNDEDNVKYSVSKAIYQQYILYLDPECLLVFVDISSSYKINEIYEYNELKGKVFLIAAEYKYDDIKHIRYNELLKLPWQNIMKYFDIFFTHSSIIKNLFFNNNIFNKKTVVINDIDAFTIESYINNVFDSINKYYSQEKGIIHKRYNNDYINNLCMLFKNNFAMKNISAGQMAKCIARTFNDHYTPQLLINICLISIKDFKTGIHRVVRNICTALTKNHPNNYNIRFVRSTGDGNFVYANEAAKRLFGFDDGAEEGVPVEANPGDIFLLIDLWHEAIIKAKNWLFDAQRQGVRIYTVYYDLIPINYPEYYDKSLVDIFKELTNLIVKFDGIICISKTVAIEIKNYCKVNNIILPEISWFHIGADFKKMPASYLKNTVDSNILYNISKNISFTLVSSIEPRKGHRQVLAAFELLWDAGLNYFLIFVAQDTWKMDDFNQYLENHPQYGKLLIVLRKLSDDYLEKIYDATTAIIMASEAEGFGLAIIEGARHKKPLILRDIEIFKEIAGENAFYFHDMNPSALAESIKKWIILYEINNHPKSDNLKWLSWDDSCNMLLSRLPIRK